MDINVNQILSNWLKELEENQLPPYEKLPDIDLYMEQMLTYLERQSHVLEKNSEDIQITSSMINNYVKGHIIKSPKSKKYTKEQISALIEIIYLKQVLALPEIKQILSIEYKDNASDAYNKYLDLKKEATKKALNDTKSKLSQCKTNSKEDLTNLALDLAAKANSYSIISKRILYLLNILNYVNDENEKKSNEDSSNFNE